MSSTTPTEPTTIATPSPATAADSTVAETKKRKGRNAITSTIAKDHASRVTKLVLTTLLEPAIFDKLVNKLTPAISEIISETNSKANARRTKDPSAPKQVNSYMLFSDSVRAQVSEKYQTKENKIISKHIGELWHLLTDEEKEVWKQEAKTRREALKVEHDAKLAEAALAASLEPTATVDAPTEDDSKAEVKKDEEVAPPAAKRQRKAPAPKAEPTPIPEPITKEVAPVKETKPKTKAPAATTSSADTPAVATSSATTVAALPSRKRAATAPATKKAATTKVAATKRPAAAPKTKAIVTEEEDDDEGNASDV